MSNVIGDVAELSKNTIVATATHEVQGASGSFDFLLSEASGIKKYFESHARVIINGPVRAGIKGQTSSTIALSAVVAICPDKYPDWPTKLEQIIQLQGATDIRLSLLTLPETVVVPFGNETTECLKPKTLIDYPPRVVGHFTVHGGSSTSKTIISVQVPLLVEGIAHHKTW